MTMEVDLTGYKDRFGTNVPPGTYTVVVSDVEEDKSKAGNAMLNVWYDVVGGDNDGATLIDRLVVSEKSLFRWVGFMSATGLPTPKKRLKIDTAKFVGRKLRIVVEDGEPYNGRVKSEVRGYMPLPSAANGKAEDAPDPLADLDDEPAPANAPDEDVPQATEELIASTEPDEVVELSLDDL